MATVKVKFRASSVATKEGTLFYQVIHKRIVRQIHTGYKLFPAEWDAVHSEVVLSSVTSESRRDYLLSLKNSLLEDSVRLKNIITRLERSGIAYTSDSLVELYCASTENNGFVSFTLNLIKELNQVGKHRTAETYMTTLNSFVRFRKGKDVLLEEVDSSLMMKYESYLKSTGICPNTTSYYMRNLRAIYNRAVEKDLTVQRSPFKYVYTGIDKTVKRAIPLEEIRRLKELDLTKSPSLAYARDIFMFSFYTRGMSFIDMAFLRKKDLQNGILSYRRQKTGQQLFIKWEKPMQEIINRYDTQGSPYLLPIIRDLEVDGQTVGGHIVSGGIVVIVGEDVALGIFDSKAPVILSKTVLTADLIDLDIISDVHGCAELCLCGIVLADLAAQIGTLAPEHGAFPGGDNNVFKVAVHSGHGELLHGMAATAGVLIPEAVV